MYIKNINKKKEKPNNWKTEYLKQRISVKREFVLLVNIPASSEVVIKNAGHFIWLEQPDQFYAGCFAWLKSQHLKEYK